MTEKRHILIVEDDLDLALIVANCCSSIGHQITLISDGMLGLEAAQSNRYDMVILDVGLPSLGGFEVCERLRQSSTSLPILMLTSRSSQADRIQGLELGADDYVTKPFDSREFVARVKALLRRTFSVPGESTADHEDQSPRVAGELVLDPKQRRVTQTGKEIPLTVLEFNVLLFFMNNPGEVFTREQLMEQVWGYSSSQFDGSVTKLLSRLRNRIEPDPQNPIFIKTIRGVGYRFTLPDERTHP